MTVARYVKDNNGKKRNVARSRWNRHSDVPRYPAEALDKLQNYRERPGWHRGAKVRYVPPKGKRKAA